jgi:hypothetical protein
MQKRPSSRPRSPFASSASTEVPALEAAAACRVPLERTPSRSHHSIRDSDYVYVAARRRGVGRPTSSSEDATPSKSPVADGVPLLEVPATGRVLKAPTTSRIIEAPANSHVHVAAPANDCVQAAAPVACCVLGGRLPCPPQSTGRAHVVAPAGGHAYVASQTASCVRVAPLLDGRVHVAEPRLHRGTSRRPCGGAGRWSRP